jgi:hypothetical protein
VAAVVFIFSPLGLESRPPVLIGFNF